jgi:hypothetical protein
MSNVFWDADATRMLVVMVAAVLWTVYVAVRFCGR